MTRKLLYAVSLFLLSVAVVSAQQLATLNVTVTDPSGSVVHGANVSVSNPDLGIARSQVTDRAGLAVLTSLTAGDYRLTVNREGFSAWDRQLTLTVGQTASVPVRLGIASVQQSVTVSSTFGAGIDADKTESSQVIPPSQISDLPIAGRDFIDLVLLTPTANVGRSTATGAQSPFQETVLQLSFGGLRETHSSAFGLDGADYSVSLSGVQHVSPSLDWVEEFRVVDGPYAADNGRNLGSVVNTITKSGTNSLHGSAYEYFRNDALDADNALSAPGLHTCGPTNSAPRPAVPSAGRRPSTSLDMKASAAQNPLSTRASSLAASILRTAWAPERPALIRSRSSSGCSRSN